MRVDPSHPDAGEPLLHWLARALAAMGGEVVIADGDENLVRSRRPDDPGTAPYLVVAAGLPNLLHEFVHAVQFGRLADDHGIDYAQIPFDVRRPEQRRLLWEELACSVLSCAYLEQDPARIDAWFAEQLEIQGVFYGLEHDLPGFLEFLEATRAAYPGELERVLGAAYAEAEAVLRAAGAPDEVARPRARLEFSGLWTRYRAARPPAARHLAPV